MVDSRGKRPTKKSRVTAKKSSRSPQIRDATVRERERQLRELTEQSLHFLDLLQDAREKNKGLEELERRIGKLEEVLGDARRRVRTSRSVVVARGTGDPTTRVEIVVWPNLPGVIDGAAVRALANRYPTVQVNCICPQEDAPVDPGSAHPANLQVLAAECQTGPGYWNTAMAATEAPVVLFLCAGVETEGDLDSLRSVEDESLVLAQPVLAHEEGPPTLGLRESGLFDFRRCAVPSETSGVLELDYVAPEAFVLRRQAFHRLGPFDEALAGYLALVDYCLRARSHALRSLGLIDVRAVVPKSLDLLTSDEQSRRDRLILTAQHRPGMVTRALGGMDLLWSLPPEPLQDYLRTLFLRLPGAPQLPDAVDVLVQEAVNLGRQGIPGPVVEQPLRALQELVTASLDLGPAEPVPRDLEGHDPIDAVRIRMDSLRATFDKLKLQLDAEKAANRNLLDRMTAQVEAERLSKKELMEKLQGYQPALDSLKAELDRARTTGETMRADLDKERALNDDLSSELEARQALVARLTGELEAERESREHQKARLLEDLDRARQSQDLLDEGIRLIAQALQADDRDPALLAERARILQEAAAEARRNLQERNRWVALLLDEIGHWRLKPFPRRLTVGEREFLQKLGQDGLG